MPPDFAFEKRLRSRGYRTIAGIDESGRGPLAGPVVAAAVILPERYRCKHLDDCKLLSPGRRTEIHKKITDHPKVAFAFAVVEVEDIDRINILRASHLAMQRAVEALALSLAPDVVLIDGLHVTGFPWPQESVVKGDTLSLSIAAASVIAKVERDRLMVRYAGQYPEYGFDSHKGYGTRQHLAALRNHGPCPIHRRSFEPVAQLTLDLA